MSTLKITVANKIATYHQRCGDIVCGNTDYQIDFIFDDEWSAHPEKTARFIWNGRYFDVDFEGNTCKVPLITNTDQVTVGVYAGDLQTTTPASINCKRSILCGGEPQRPESAEQYANEAKVAADRAEAALTQMNQKAQLFEYEADLPFYDKDAEDPAETPMSVGLDRVYDGKTLDIVSITLSAYIVDNTTKNESYFIHDITRALQGIEKGRTMAFKLGGVAPINTSDSLSIYGFKVDVERVGEVYNMRTVHAVVGDSFNGATLHRGKLTNVKIRSILASPVTVIGLKE